MGFELKITSLKIELQFKSARKPAHQTSENRPQKIGSSENCIIAFSLYVINPPFKANNALNCSIAHFEPYCMDHLTGLLAHIPLLVGYSPLVWVPFCLRLVPIHTRDPLLVFPPLQEQNRWSWQREERSHEQQEDYGRQGEEGGYVSCHCLLKRNPNAHLKRHFVG